MHLSRRALLTTVIALWLVGAIVSPAVGRAPEAPPNPVTDGFMPRSLAFFDVDSGIVAGTIVCPTLAAMR